jgi:hypothetical protein
VVMVSSYKLMKDKIRAIACKLLSQMEVSTILNHAPVTIQKHYVSTKRMYISP